jgi:hypothetical protein
MNATSIAISKHIGSHVTLTAYLEDTQVARWQSGNLKTEVSIDEFDCSIWLISDIEIEVDDIVLWRQSMIRNEVELA